MHRNRATTVLSNIARWIAVL